jgi:UDP-N-acetyl-D-mannosaminuronic acid dehydrogenase
MLGKDLLDYPKGEPSIYVLARHINDFMPTHMFHLTMDALERAGRSPQGAKVAILGWAFLANSDDTRNTPAEPYRDQLIQAGATVRVHDPYVNEYSGVPILQNLDDAMKGVDAIVIFAGHYQYKNMDPKTIRTLSGKAHPVIIDGRNMIDPDLYISHGFVYKGVGRGDKNSHKILR